MMKITKVTPVKPKVDRKVGVEVSVGEFNDATSDWFQADITSLHDQLEVAGIEYVEYTLMRKASGAINGLLVGLLILGTPAAFELLKAWLPARQGRKMRVRFKDGSEIEATSVKELEQLRDKFLAHQPEERADEN